MNFKDDRNRNVEAREGAETKTAGTSAAASAGKMLLETLRTPVSDSSGSIEIKATGGTVGRKPRDDQKTENADRPGGGTEPAPFPKMTPPTEESAPAPSTKVPNAKW